MVDLAINIVAFVIVAGAALLVGWLVLGAIGFAFVGVTEAKHAASEDAQAYGTMVAIVLVIVALVYFL